MLLYANGRRKSSTRRSRIRKKRGRRRRPIDGQRISPVILFEADIEGIIRIGMRGLDVYPDGTFRPDEQVDRASYAMMIEDILIKVAGDNALATRFIGSPSPFPDLRADLPYFNAVMVVTSRGIMEVKDIATGEFAPLGPVGGRGCAACDTQDQGRIAILDK